MRCFQLPAGWTPSSHAGRAQPSFHAGQAQPSSHAGQAQPSFHAVQPSSDAGPNAEPQEKLMEFLLVVGPGVKLEAACSPERPAPTRCVV